MSRLQTTLGDIPLASCGFFVNGKPGLEWVMERQAVTTTKTAAFPTKPSSGPS